MPPQQERRMVRRRFFLALLSCAACVAFVFLMAGISVQDFFIYGGSICLASTVFVLILMVGCMVQMESSISQGAQFESSDGLWTDSTSEFKCHGFDAVLYSFEAYKPKHGRPDVTLVRVSPEPKWWFIHTNRKRSDPKWKVPFQVSSGHARTLTLDLNEQESDEVRRRADAAMEYWQKL